MPRIGIILGSTRPNRNGEQVARWVYDIAQPRTDAQFELVDLRDYPLPHLDEALPPSLGQYQNEHTKQWAAKIASFDGFVFVTPEYNHGTSGVLKNAIDYLYAEWNNKAVGFVSYGAVGGARAAEHLRLVVGELQMADVRQQVSPATGHRVRELQRLQARRQPAASAHRPAGSGHRLERRALRSSPTRRHCHELLNRCQRPLV